MASKCTQKLSDMVTCPICLEVLKNPKMLKCFHFFCHACLIETDEIVEGEQVGYNCPMCRQFTAEDQLHMTPFMHDLLEAFELAKKDERPCTMCQKEIPMWRCVDCKSTYCVTCRASHDRIPMCANHKCVSLEGTSKEVCVDKLVFCKVHPEKVLELNCASCDELICVLCKAIGHEGHKAETISDALNRILPELEMNRARIEDNRKISLRTVDALKNEVATVDQNYAKLQKQADEKLAEVIRKSKADHAEETKRLEEKKKSEVIVIQKKIDDLKLKDKSQESVLSWTDATLQNAHNASLLQELQSGLRETLLSMGKVVVHQQHISRFIFTPLDLIQSATVHCEKKFKEFNEYSTRFTVLEEEIWSCHSAFDKICIMSLDLNQIRTIRLQGSSCGSVVPVDKYVAVACNNGLQLIERDGRVVDKIAEGDFVDVSARDHTIYALDNKMGAVIVCTRQSAAKWVKTETLKLENYYRDTENTLQITHDGFYVCIRGQRCIQKYFSDGKLVATYRQSDNGLEYGLRICGIDCHGNLLVSNYYNNCIQVLKADGSWKILFTDSQPGPMCAFPDHDGKRMFVYFCDGIWKTFLLR